MQDAILVHGLWVPGVVMKPLAARLARAGFRCHTFSYLGALRPLAAHAERLAHMARAIGPAHFIGHSLGGLVVLEALIRHPGIAVGRVVLLGTSVRGNLAGRRLARFTLGRWLLGKSEPLWRERHPAERERHPAGHAARWTRAERLGVIAGTRAFGLGRLLGPLAGTNDGVVTLEETAVEGMSERITFPVGHSAMLVSARVAAQVAAFLTYGKFAPIPD